MFLSVTYFKSSFMLIMKMLFVHWSGRNILTKRYCKTQGCITFNFPTCKLKDYYTFNNFEPQILYYIVVIIFISIKTVTKNIIYLYLWPVPKIYRNYFIFLPACVENEKLLLKFQILSSNLSKYVTWYSLK